MSLQPDTGLIDRLVSLGFDPRYGARPLKRAIEQHVVSVIAAVLSQAGANPPPSLELSVADAGAIVAR